MRTCRWFLLLGLWISTSIASNYFDFDTAMQIDKFPEAIDLTRYVVGVDGTILLDFCRQLYRKNNPSYLPVMPEPIIPKIIHQIWLGSPVPEVFKQYMQTWTVNHLGPDWRYKLWTDEDVETLDLYNRDFYDSVDNPGVKSDILRYELVYQFGGAYVDIDFECLKPLDILHYMYDFYTALQPLDSQYVQLGMGLFGAAPKHPILAHCIETIKDDWDKKSVVQKTGPVHFTRSFYATAGRNGLKDVALPAFYFYPLGCSEHFLHYQQWIQKGAFAVHHWAKSWMDQKFRRYAFKDLYNDEITRGME